MDVKTEFLNGILKEAVYMMQPASFVDPMVANCRISGSAIPLRFELWGACEELVLSDLPTHRLDELELRTGKEMDSEQFTQVRATLRCNTLLLLCGGLPLCGLWVDEYNGDEEAPEA